MAQVRSALSVFVLTFIVLVCLIEISAWAPRRPKRRLSAQQKLEKSATKYLMKYGYYTSWAPNPVALRNAVKSFQTFNWLPITGEVDKAIVHKLKQPRCGVKDPIVLNENDFKSFYVAGSIWKKKMITWYWDGKKDNNKYMTVEETYTALQDSFDIWRKSCIGVEFHQTDDPVIADITIIFSKKHHRCPFPHDGPGESMMHAFYPYGNKGLAGDIHFDDEDVFNLKQTSNDGGINFLWAATHSIGHSLGLENSPNPDSMMYPWYNPTNPTLRLHQSDIDGIKSLYPKKDCLKPEVVELTKIKKPIVNGNINLRIPKISSRLSVNKKVPVTISKSSSEKVMTTKMAPVDLLSTRKVTITVTKSSPEKLVTKRLSQEGTDKCNEKDRSLNKKVSVPMSKPLSEKVATTKMSPEGTDKYNEKDRSLNKKVSVPMSKPSSEKVPTTKMSPEGSDKYNEKDRSLNKKVSVPMSKPSSEKVPTTKMSPEGSDKYNEKDRFSNKKVSVPMSKPSSEKVPTTKMSPEGSDKYNEKDRFSNKKVSVPMSKPLSEKLATTKMSPEGTDKYNEKDRTLNKKVSVPVSKPSSEKVPTTKMSPEGSDKYNEKDRFSNKKVSVPMSKPSSEKVQTTKMSPEGSNKYNEKDRFSNKKVSVPMSKPLSEKLATTKEKTDPSTLHLQDTTFPPLLFDDVKAVEKFEELFDPQLIENVNSIEDRPLSENNIEQEHQGNKVTYNSFKRKLDDLCDFFKRIY